MKRRVIPRPAGLLWGFFLSGAIPKRFSRGVKDASTARGAIITLLPTYKGGRVEVPQSNALRA